MTTAIDKDFEAPEPEFEIDDTDGAWMYDIGRDYWDQLVEYKRYKDERVEEVA